MPREVVCTGPVPEQGEKWCTMCAIRFKTEVLEQQEVQAHIVSLEHGDGPAVTFDLTKAAREHHVKFPELAVTISVCMQLNGTLVPLCWGHVAAIKFTALAPGSAGQVPALVPGRR